MGALEATLELDINRTSTNRRSSRPLIAFAKNRLELECLKVAKL